MPLSERTIYGSAYRVVDLGKDIATIALRHELRLDQRSERER